MTRLLCVQALTLLAGLATGVAGDYPLTFKTIPAGEVMAFPGGYGAYGTVRITKPVGLKKEPKAISAHPLYGQCREGEAQAGFLFRLDESKGDGKGYDRLIADMNGNGDLTDDVVLQPEVTPEETKRVGPQQISFGPIEAPAGTTIAGGRPMYYAQVFVYNTTLLRQNFGGQLRNLTFGQLRLKAGWYLETTVALDGAKKLVGVYDGNSNLRLGDIPQPQTYTNQSVKSWFFNAGDSLLVDANGSGSFESDLFESEACAFSPILYLGAKPYKLALSDDNRSLRVDPWPDALAEVALGPRGDQVRTVTLAWEQPDGKWQLIRPGAAGGKIKVPPGNYRLYTCNLLGNAGQRDQVMASAYQRAVQQPVAFTADRDNSLKCGAPLEIKVTAQKSRQKSGVLFGTQSRDSQKDSDYELAINAEVIGAGGEAYSSYAKGDKLQDKPAKPKFMVLDARGRKLKDGNLEFG
jgi:hypothetical protein